MEFRNAFPPGSVAYGFDGSLWVVNDSGDKRLPFPALCPYDPDEELVTWPRTELYFVTMCGVRHAVIAQSMREANLAIEVANGWN